MSESINQGVKKVLAVILAAGKGTRMKTTEPKVMCQISSKPMIQWVIEALKDSGVGTICAVINQSMDYKMIKKMYSEVYVCYQHNQLGTADAVASCGVFLSRIDKPSYNISTSCEDDSEKIIDCDYILVCSGDTPAISSKSISEFIKGFLDSGASFGVVGFRPKSSFGYGRLKLDKSFNLDSIIEEKDASTEEKKISLCNSGVIIARKNELFESLKKILPSNSQKEYYLTDCFGVARRLGKKIFVYEAKDYHEFLGVNDREQLARMEEILKR